MNGHEFIGQPKVEQVVAPTPAIDPLRYCVMTTVALLAWAFGPFTVMVMGAIGFFAYWRATRGGLTRSKCVLKYPALVMTYLGLACLAGGISLVM